METFQMVWEEIYEELNIKYSGTSDDITTTTGSTKQSKLSRTDILAIRSIYDTLDKSKIWKINTWHNCEGKNGRVCFKLYS